MTLTSMHYIQGLSVWYIMVFKIYHNKFTTYSVGLWNAFYVILYAIGNATRLMRYSTRWLTRNVLICMINNNVNFSQIDWGDFRPFYLHRVHSGRMQRHLQGLSKALLDPGGWNMGSQVSTNSSHNGWKIIQNSQRYFLALNLDDHPKVSLDDHPIVNKY